MNARIHIASTRVDEIADGIFRMSTPVPASVVPGGFTFNQFLIRDAEPLLFHTGPRMLFASVREAIDRVLPVSTLRYISFSHVEADECGSLNQYLAAAPLAVPLCGRTAAMVSIGDLADRPPRVLADQERLTLGAHVVQWIDAPHVPHGWECGFLAETTTSTLLCGDLFTQLGDMHPASLKTTSSSRVNRRGSKWTTTRTRRTPVDCSNASQPPHPRRWPACTVPPGGAMAARC
jgi:glyoxylase-like metal-dependent hydrolase (beta-lactamase superfamily II)